MRRSLEDREETLAMNRQSLHVGFGGRKVAVSSDAPEVLAGFARIFREMLESEPTMTVERLEVQWREGKYNVSGITEACIEYGSLADTVERPRYEVLLRLIQARSDLLWLHAGAAAYQCSSVMILGSWGRGKSTLVTSLYANGWTYLSDDVVPLDPNSGRAFPFPLTANGTRLWELSRLYAHSNEPKATEVSEVLCLGSVCLSSVGLDFATRGSAQQFPPSRGVMGARSPHSKGVSLIC